MRTNESVLDNAIISYKPIPDEVFKDLLPLWPSILLIMCPIGLWANWIVIRTFLRMGLNDSVTISFFCLGLSDFAHVFCALISIVSYVLDLLEANFHSYFRVQSLVVYVYVVTFASNFNNVTTFITIFLAVQRCLCIVKPLHFKDMFTKKITWVIMGCFALFSTISTTAYLASYSVADLTIQHRNVSQYVITTKSWYKYAHAFVGMANYTILPIAGQCLVFGSVIVMSNRLRASIQFRNDASSVNASRKTGGIDTTKKNQEHDEDEKQYSKEQTAIIQVAVLSTVFLVTNLPKIIVHFGAVSVPGFGFGLKYANTFRVALTLRLCCDYLNSTVNFFIYYKYNSRFRDLCFLRKKKVVKHLY